MKQLFTFFLFAFLIQQVDAQNVLGVRPPDANVIAIETFDPFTGDQIGSTDITISGVNIQGFTGLASDPTQNTLYIIAKDGPNFHLATLDPVTGVGTSVGILGDRFAGITFGDDGTLYGITGDGGSAPSTLFTIDPATAAITSLVTPGGGSDGEAIAFNPNDGLIYRFGGDIFQSINPTTLAVETISTPDVAAYSHALTFDSNTGDFIFAAGPFIYTLGTDGTLSQISTDATGSGYKGLVFEEDLMTSAGEITEAITLDIFPNPVADQLHIQLEETASVARVEIYNLQGQLADVRIFQNTDLLEVSVAAFATGTYLVKVNQGDKIGSSLFIKQ
jgi:hypothetical protein